MAANAQSSSTAEQVSFRYLFNMQTALCFGLGNQRRTWGKMAVDYTFLTLKSNGAVCVVSSSVRFCFRITNGRVS